jgi:hypothetical protein
MTPTETEVLALYKQLDPSRLAGETIACVYHDDYTLVMVTESEKYVKLGAPDDDRLDFESLTVLDLKCMRLIDLDTWEQILAERKTSQRTRRRSDAEITIARLVLEHGADTIRDLIRE